VLGRAHAMPAAEPRCRQEGFIPSWYHGRPCAGTARLLGTGACAGLKIHACRPARTVGLAIFPRRGSSGELQRWWAPSLNPASIDAAVFPPPHRRGARARGGLEPRATMLNPVSDDWLLRDLRRVVLDDDALALFLLRLDKPSAPCLTSSQVAPPPCILLQE
jgi:hypothetical protein